MELLVLLVIVLAVLIYLFQTAMETQGCATIAVVAGIVGFLLLIVVC